MELKRPLAVWSPEKTTKLLTKVLPDMTTNLSLASLVAVMMDTAVTNDMSTLFLLGCCSGLWRRGPVWQCLQKLSKLTLSCAAHCLEPFLRDSFCIERWSHTSLVPTEEDIWIFFLEKGLYCRGQLKLFDVRQIVHGRWKRFCKRKIKKSQAYRLCWCTIFHPQTEVVAGFPFFYH